MSQVSKILLSTGTIAGVFWFVSTLDVPMESAFAASLAVANLLFLYNEFQKE